MKELDNSNKENSGSSKIFRLHSSKVVKDSLLSNASFFCETRTLSLPHLAEDDDAIERGLAD